MNKHIHIVTLAAGIMLFSAMRAEAVIVDTWFGYNYLSADVYLSGSYVALDAVDLNSITYEGETGLQTLMMPDVFRDGAGLYYDPYYLTDLDGASTRTHVPPEALPIDWIRPGVTTPWGQVYDFPTIGITEITVLGVSGVMRNDSVYVVGLINETTGNNELVSVFSDERGDIYDSGRAAIFTATDFVSPDYAYGSFIFSAASSTVIPVPAAVWLFGSGLLGLAAVSRLQRRQAS